MKEWHYNEFKQVGVDFDSEEEVRLYDEKYKKSRNLKDELDNISKAIDLKPESVVLEIGTGTAELAIGMAKSCKKVIAADVSRTMLSYAQKKATNQLIDNIEFKHSGFLNINSEPQSLDAVVSQLTLHHLPDFWKSIAIKNVSQVLKTGGKFFLLDSILSFDVNYDEYFTNNVEKLKETLGEKMAQEIIVNIRDEYPTFDWIIEKMLKQAGLKIDLVHRYNELFTMFICTKE